MMAIGISRYSHVPFGRLSQACPAPPLPLPRRPPIVPPTALSLRLLLPQTAKLQAFLVSALTGPSEVVEPVASPDCSGWRPATPLPPPATTSAPVATSEGLHSGPLASTEDLLRVRSLWVCAGCACGSATPMSSFVEVPCTFAITLHALDDRDVPCVDEAGATRVLPRPSRSLPVQRRLLCRSLQCSGLVSIWCGVPAVLQGSVPCSAFMRSLNVHVRVSQGQRRPLCCATLAM